MVNMGMMMVTVTIMCVVGVAGQRLSSRHLMVMVVMMVFTMLMVVSTVV